MTDNYPFPDETTPDISKENPTFSESGLPEPVESTSAETTIAHSVEDLPPAAEEPAPTLADPPDDLPSSSESPLNFSAASVGAQAYETPAFPPPGTQPGVGSVPHVSPPPPVNQGSLSPQDERMYAMLAHLSVLLNLFTGFLGQIAALVIYLVYKDRSRYVANQSMQAFLFQLIVWIGGWVIAGLAWTISGVLAMILVGCLIMPCALLLTFIPFIALIYGVIGAVQTNNGQDFQYWLIGDMVKNI